MTKDKNALFFLNQKTFSTIFVVVIFLCLISGFVSGCKLQKRLSADAHFSYNIPISPQSFDPLLQRGTTARYLLNHLYITLYKWDKNNTLKPYAAQKCEWQNTDLVCKLKRDLFFQDGTQITANHFLNTLKLLEQNQNTDSLDFKTTQYESPDPFTLVFKSKKRSQSLLDKMTLLEISPRKEKIFYKDAKDVISSTNYKIDHFVKNQFLTLKHQKEESLIVKIYFIEDQATALRLFRTGKLNLLTQLQIREIPSYENSEKLFYVHMIRMDGIFFHSDMNANLKKAMFHAANFSDLKSIYRSKGLPGCPPIPHSFYETEKDNFNQINDQCYTFNVDKAQRFLKMVPEKERLKPIKLSYSSMGGDDIQRGMEWFAHQWKKNLDLNISIEPLESGLFLQRVQSKNFEIIRKGIPLDNPTCLDALRSFKSGDPNNFTQFKTQDFDSILSEMDSQSEPNVKKNQNLCYKGLKLLHQNYAYIPLGPMYFSFLTDGTFKGWSINSLNVLDIEELASE